MTTRKSDGKNYKQAKPTQGHKVRFNYFKAGTQVRHTVTSLQLAAINRPGTREEKILQDNESPNKPVLSFLIDERQSSIFPFERT